VDRFMLKVILEYPSIEEERRIIRSIVNIEGQPKANKVISQDDIMRARDLVKQIYMDEKIEKYIVDLVFATRFPHHYGLEYLQPMITCGCSPRASINLAIASKAFAFLQGRAFVIPEDVRAIALDVMRHRIGLSYEAEAENLKTSDIILKIINKVEVP
ncbi:MAG TPA: MoxR family ATPase, partial [Taishania sp.]|nr:MoxR family ATPase [Taishania sp.]